MRNRIHSRQFNQWFLAPFSGSFAAQPVDGGSGGGAWTCGVVNWMYRTDLASGAFSFRFNIKIVHESNYSITESQ
jgi:hypothetical protein